MEEKILFIINVYIRSWTGVGIEPTKKKYLETITSQKK
jgi:hypothetical protein